MIRALVANAVKRKAYRSVVTPALSSAQTLLHSNINSNPSSRPLRVLSAFLCTKSSPETELTSTQETACPQPATQAHEFIDPLVGKETDESSDIEEEIEENLSSSDLYSDEPELSDEPDSEEDSVTFSDHNEQDDPESSSVETIDMSNVSEELKEMLQEGYVIQDLEENLPFDSSSELLTIEEVKQVLEEVRARDVQIFPVQDRCEWTDMMVVATGISDRHVRGIAEALVYKIKKKGQVEPSLYPTIEGQVGGKWLVVDCGNIIIHVLNEESRAYYKLEDMWAGDLKPSTADEDFEKMLGKVGLKTVSR